MKFTVCSLLIIGSLSLTQAVIADCNFPNMNINFPNGSKASEQEMIETQKKVKAAQSGLITYRECLDKELSSISQELENYPEIERIIIDEGSPADIVKRNKNRDSIYIPIPYQFYEDYMTDWLNTKKIFELSLQDLKTHIKNNTKWSFDGSDDARSYNVYKTYKDYGVANPVFNNGETYPKRSTHITAYCFLNKSDVPILFKRPENNINRFLVQPKTEELPYFKGKYLTLDIDIKNKLVNFFLENEHIGVYKG